MGNSNSRPVVSQTTDNSSGQHNFRNMSDRGAVTGENRSVSSIDGAPSEKNDEAGQHSKNNTSGRDFYAMHGTFDPEEGDTNAVGKTASSSSNHSSLRQRLRLSDRKRTRNDASSSSSSSQSSLGDNISCGNVENTHETGESSSFNLARSLRLKKNLKKSKRAEAQRQDTESVAPALSRGTSIDTEHAQSESRSQDAALSPDNQQIDPRTNLQAHSHTDSQMNVQTDSQEDSQNLSSLRRRILRFRSALQGGSNTELSGSLPPARQRVFTAPALRLPHSFANSQQSSRSLRSIRDNRSTSSPFEEPFAAVSHQPDAVRLSSSARASLIARLFRSRSHQSSQDRHSSSSAPSNSESGQSNTGATSVTSGNDEHRQLQNLLQDENEDQASMLSRLLSMAAAATAASLTGTDSQEALSQARDVANSDGEGASAGSFEEFLQGLRNGRLMTALNGNRPEQHQETSEDQADSQRDSQHGSQEASRDVSQGGEGEQQRSLFLGGHESLNFFRMFRFNAQPPSDDGEPGAPATIPVIIVGVRAVPHTESGIQADDGHTGEPTGIVPSFGDLIQNMGNRLSSSSQTSGISSAPRTSEHQSPEVESNHSDRLSEAHERARAMERSIRERLEESMRRSERSESINEDSMSNSSLAARAEQSSERRSETGVGQELQQSRGNQAEDGTNNGRRARSWIIYVLGGNYPENHPILTTPSLFTDSPTYEDMMMLSTIIGNAKPPTATREEVDASGRIEIMKADHSTYGDRCLICLNDYEIGDECRSIEECEHFFHRGCLDEWLTTGRNSCPLCRCQGVKTKQSSTTGTTAGSAVSTETDHSVSSHRSPLS